MTDEPTGFLYPFIESEERDAARLVGELAQSAQAKMAESLGLRETTLARWHHELERAAGAMAGRFRRPSSAGWRRRRRAPGDGGVIEPGGPGVRADRGVSPPAAPAARRRRHPRPRGRRQGVRRAPGGGHHAGVRQRRPRGPDRRRGNCPAVRRPTGLQRRLLRGEAPAIPRRLCRPPGRARHHQRPRRHGRGAPSPSPPPSCWRKGFSSRGSAVSWQTWPRRQPAPAYRS
jgi:hypothetical protein